MKTVFRSIILTVWMVVLVSCGQDSNEILVIDTQATAPSEVFLSEFFRNDGMVPLETNDSCLITFINKVIRTRDEFFILSSKGYENEILKFDRNGKFICRIGRIGNGPGEYRNLHCMSIDTINNQIIAADHTKILFFSYDGSLTKSYTLPSRLFIEDMYLLDNSLWTFGIRFSSASLVENFFYRYNDKFQLTDSLIFARYNSATLRVTANPNIISDISSGRYIYFPVINSQVKLRDTLFRFDGSNLKPEIKLDFKNTGKNNYPEIEIISNESKGDLKQFNSLKIESVFRTDKFLFVNYQYKLSYYFIYDFKNRKGHINSGFKDDLFIKENNVLFGPHPLDLKKGEFYCSVSGVHLDGKLEGVNENSNPVIFFFKLKNNELIK